jgi:hypothetical protein
MAHRTLAGLPQYSFHREAAYAFVDGIRGRDIKFPSSCVERGCSNRLSARP